jgi:nucleotide-binding universal stress UspA family protein
VHSSKGGDEDARTVIQNRDALADLQKRLGAEGFEVTVRDFARGKDPSEDLIDVADKDGAALIVIGLRRRSPVGKLLMGSNAQEILLRADCPVLAVKAT